MRTKNIIGLVMMAAVATALFVKEMITSGTGIDHVISLMTLAVLGINALEYRQLLGTDDNDAVNAAIERLGDMPNLESLGETTGQAVAALTKGIPGLSEALTRARLEGQGMGLSVDAMRLAQQLPQIASTLQGLTDKSEAEQLKTIQKLAPQMQQIMESVQSPEAQQLRQMLNQQAIGGLGAGEQLTDEQRRASEQALRGGEVSRGIGMGQGSANREAVSKALEGRRLQQERQQFAEQRLASERGLLSDPYAIYNNLQGTTSQALGAYSGLLGQYQNPLGGAQSALSAGQQQQGAQYQSALQQNQAGMLSQLAPLLTQQTPVSSKDEHQAWYKFW